MKALILATLVFTSAWSEACTCLGKDDFISTSRKADVTLIVKYLGSEEFGIDPEVLVLFEEGDLPALDFPKSVKFEVKEALVGSITTELIEIDTVSLCSDVSLIYKTFLVGEIYILALNTNDRMNFSIPGCSEYAARTSGDFVYRIKYSNGGYFDVPFMSMEHYRGQLNSNKELHH
jgi:hypothetical protein